MPRRPPADEKLLQRVVRLGQLTDLYGALLTDKQREFMRLHYEEDLSFGEIAAEHRVSRQAIHDAVKHAEKSLEEYEAKLGLLARVKPEREAGSGGPAGEAVEILEGLLKRLRSAGVIYNSEWIAGEVKRVIELLRGDAAAGETEESPARLPQEQTA